MRFVAAVILLCLVIGATTSHEEASAQTSSQVTAQIGLNLRTGPGMGYEIITVMPYGAFVTTGDWSGVWVSVSYNGYSGWAHSNWLGQATQPAASPSTSGGGGGGYSWITGGYYSATVIDAIYYWAAYYGVSGDWLYWVAHCESGFDPNAIGPNGEIGVFQFMSRTFYAYGGVNIWDPWDQARVAAYMFSQGLSWHWVCAQ